MQKIDFKKYSKFVMLGFSDGTPKKAILTAIVVGTLLTWINHGNSMMVGQFPSLIKIALTYLVPYCVTTWGAIITKLSQTKHETTESPNIH